MSDALELLEAIGQSAALRHPPVEELAGTLDKAGVSEALKATVASGGTSPLFEELGQKPMHGQRPGHEDDEDDSERPSTPEPDQPSRQK